MVLVPGFLGFSRFGGFYYFAERVIAALRGALEERLGYPVQVVPCMSHPTEGLEPRQRRLVKYLDDFCNKTLVGVRRIHLVGHSSGGVDVQFLTCTKPFGRQAWSRQANTVRRKITSVVTISAPHYGTCLADSWLGYWAENPFSRLVPIVFGIKLGCHLLRLVPKELPAIQRFQLVQDMIVFLTAVAFHRNLIADLRPSNMEMLRSKFCAESGISLTCFVTGTQLRMNRKRFSDTFFTDMYNLTKGDGQISPAMVQSRLMLQTLIKHRPDLVIRSPDSPMTGNIEYGLNDGIINSVRQVVDPNNSSQVGGFVVADHADVIGHYDRQDSLIEGAPYDAGVFRSGAGFGDDEFFKLYQHVAKAILK